MDKQDDLNNNFDKTEDFTELIDDINMNTITETLELPNFNKYPEFKREIYSKKETKEEDFSDLIKKRDYKGFNSELNGKNKTKKIKLKKWVYILILFVLIGGGLGIYKIINNKVLRAKEEKQSKIAEIENHFSKFVKVSGDTVLYEKTDNDYEEIGRIYKDVIVELIDDEINENTRYFHIKDLDYYISYNDVIKSDIEINTNDRYKKYLPFNINIVTKDSFTMNLESEKYLTLNKEMEFPVIINDYDGKYYVEYNNQLVSISKDDIKKTIESKNTEKKNQSKMTTLAYFKVYDKNDTCTEKYLCLNAETFDKQMKYLSDNDYFTLNLDEMYMYLKGNLQVEKGVVITFDDGYLFKVSDEILNKYNLNGTMFVISGDFIDKYDIFDNLKAIDIQSHSHKLHKNYACSGGNEGGAILCAGKEKIVEDLKTSLDALKIKPIGFAYPFYDYNDTAIEALKEVGFKMAFVGRAGVMGRATPKETDMYKIPRMTVWEENLMDFNTWKSYL